ncbi:hypothetical protein KSU1_B0568 [Candidatus Jettenia caeni]|uniref:Uncharacterized protein n=1 Tax=Candidatus Jettenia caeni TaxID=247490 RepID=I3II80_9BACT|nr:hypothetical protein [Candidatus Jettenia sp. AMX1]NUN23807.1 hypothetical protein [Candidatus Jettenia caeni]MDL1938088.1 hypothetical protein [Candidatus Jettenia sp. AMX1]WKZ16745.1 MAG: hypothetical protein QY317_05415 [Candidatus Jettenia caeni]GAB61425.1 hypothetical protein KSU1_B0568 [Candidatus Jettenia caeni]GIL20873.1 MAG: hypothetical protein BroJett041_19870 [Candidatus Jettenia caeni]
MSNQTITRTKEVSVQNNARYVSTTKMSKQMMGKARKSIMMIIKRVMWVLSRKKERKKFVP